MSTKPNWKLLTILILGLILTTQETKAQNSKADEIAKDRSIFIKKEITNTTTIYDYGQTKMELTPAKYVTPKGNIYFSKLELEIPEQETAVNLTLDETRVFLKKLAGIYQLDKYRDENQTWTQKKRYFFSIDSFSNQIYFQLNVEEDDFRFESTAKGGINEVIFTINDFEENGERVSKAISKLMDALSRKENDLMLSYLEDNKGISGYKIDYNTFYDNGLEVYKSDVHDTNSLRILSDQKVSRSKRLIPVSEYEGKFKEYSLVYDENLNFYVQEEISISSMAKEIIGLVQQHNGDGVLDLKIHHDGEIIYTTFSIVKSGYEQAKPNGQDS